MAKSLDVYSAIENIDEEIYDLILSSNKYYSKYQRRPYSIEKHIRTLQSVREWLVNVA